MTSNNQVSPAIRISRGERDASARATHLKAASRKYLETTIERKQMSTTTNFKRIALVAVAALGLGVLSSVPSQAVINQDLLTLSATTASQTTAETSTASSATATFTFLGSAFDSASVTASLVSGPTGNTALPFLAVVESSSAATTTLSGLTAASNAPLKLIDTSVSAAVVSYKARVYLSLDQTNGTSAPAVPGTYVVKLTPAVISAGSTLSGASAQTLTITVTTAATQDKVASVANSTTYIWAGNGANKLLASADSAVVNVKTSSLGAGTQVATLYTTQKNAAGTAADESVTATITGAGILGTGTTAGSIAAAGRSLSIVNGSYVAVFADGTAGVGTITLTGATSGLVLSTKTVTFTATTPTSFGPSTIAATDSSVIAVAGTTKVWAKALEGVNTVQGLTGSTDIWAFSDATSIATVGTVGSFDATYGYPVTVTGVAVGTANIVFGNASTLAASTIKSAPVAVRVGSGVASNVTLTTDKATYAPGEKITLTVTILDSTGKAVVGATSYANIFTSAGVTASINLASGTLPTGTISDYSNTTNTKTYTLYAPVTGGTLTFSATGGTALATANQVAKSVSVTVSDNASAALAAVTALATTVASLKTLIVTLTNLVLKIQKKVKA
jgi:trimeric autotransporter adhesin